MPRTCWPLQAGRSVLHVTLAMPTGALSVTRTLLADTGGASLNAPFELILSTADCQQFKWRRSGAVGLDGAFSGAFPIYSLRVEIPTLQLTQIVAAVAVPAALLPAGLDGIAGFRFIDSFNHGNFGSPDQFCLETL